MRNYYTQSSALGFLTRAISILISACLLAAALVSPASATHWRYAQITWTQAADNTVNVTVQQAWRRSFFGSSCIIFVAGFPVGTTCTGVGGLADIGEIVGGGGLGWSLNWGDSSTTELFLEVTSIDPAKEFVTCTEVFT